MRMQLPTYKMCLKFQYLGKNWAIFKSIQITPFLLTMNSLANIILTDLMKLVELHVV